jgi:aminoglycoside phosphotransferase (APT) family kinase protein
MTDADVDAGVDTADLEAYLSAELDATVVGTEVLHDGLNLSIAVSTAADDRAFVVRRPRKLRHTDLFNDPAQEYGLLQRLESTPVAAPAPVLFCEDESILGDHFFVTTHLDGEAVPLGSDLPERFRSAASREHLANRLVDSLARIHSLDPEPFADVCERQTPLAQVAHATDRLDAAASVTGRDRPTLRFVGKWLRRNAPSEARTALVHGDFRPGNVLFAGTDRPELAGVLDWETAMLGDPLTELGYLLLRWRDDGDPTPDLDALEARYPDSDVIAELREVNEHGLAPFTAKPGSPTRRDLVARYENRTGIEYANDRFYRAHAAFMLASVWADLHRFRVEAGAESGFPPHIDYVTMIADSIVNGEFEL